jgi:predicted alpha/beta-fold hydrolase
MDKYKPHVIFRNGHISTIYAGLIRPNAIVEGGQRIRLQTPDEDFLDLDFYTTESTRLVVLLHGLEGSSTRPYIQHMVNRFRREGWDALAMNFRGCSGQPNNQLRTYHSGETGDLSLVLDWVGNHKNYKDISIIGFSLGGNVLMKYLGECGKNTPVNLRAGVGFSVPCDLESSNAALGRGISKGYALRFLRTLKPKALAKNERFPGKLDREAIAQADSLEAFDNAFTAPVHGFNDAKDYWSRSSCLPYLERICIPALLVQAKDDPFLSPLCFPNELIKDLPFLILDAPHHGGHVGFPNLRKGFYWSEERAFGFCSSHNT